MYNINHHSSLVSTRENSKSEINNHRTNKRFNHVHDFMVIIDTILYNPQSIPKSNVTTEHHLAFFYCSRGRVLDVHRRPATCGVPID